MFWRPTITLKTCLCQSICFGELSSTTNWKDLLNFKNKIFYKIQDNIWYWNGLHVMSWCFFLYVFWNFNPVELYSIIFFFNISIRWLAIYFSTLWLIVQRFRIHGGSLSVTQKGHRYKGRAWEKVVSRAASNIYKGSKVQT